MEKIKYFEEEIGYICDNIEIKEESLRKEYLV